MVFEYFDLTATVQFGKKCQTFKKDRFIHLPLGDGSIPYNYCVIPEMWKQFLPAEYASILKYYSEQLLRPIC